MIIEHVTNDEINEFLKSQIGNAFDRLVTLERTQSTVNGNSETEGIDAVAEINGGIFKIKFNDIKCHLYKHKGNILCLSYSDKWRKFMQDKANAVNLGKEYDKLVKAYIKKMNKEIDSVFGR